MTVSSMAARHAARRGRPELRGSSWVSPRAEGLVRSRADSRPAGARIRTSRARNGPGARRTEAPSGGSGAARLASVPERLRPDARDRGRRRGPRRERAAHAESAGERRELAPRRTHAPSDLAKEGLADERLGRRRARRDRGRRRRSAARAPARASVSRASPRMQHELAGDARCRERHRPAAESRGPSASAARAALHHGSASRGSAGRARPRRDGGALRLERVDAELRAALGERRERRREVPARVRCRRRAGTAGASRPAPARARRGGRARRSARAPRATRRSASGRPRRARGARASTSRRRCTAAASAAHWSQGRCVRSPRLRPSARPAARPRAGAAPSSRPMRAGLGDTRTPARSSAAILSAAVPLPPEMIAPAWPMRLPGGAVAPAMKPTTGFLTLGGDVLGRAAPRRCRRSRRS